VMRRFSVFRDTGWLTVMVVLLAGVIGSAVSIELGYITVDTIARYGMWVVLALVAFMLFSRETKTEWDGIIASYLLLMSIGGLIATYMIQQGIRTGYIVLGALFLLFIVLLILYGKHGYRKTILSRFNK